MGTTNDNDGSGDMDICRVCRLTGNDALYHPCLCTGSIKYIHQDCLLQWLKYSKKDVCELCNHKFSFRPLYRADMPERLPLRDLLRGIFMIVARFLRLGFTYTLVLTCWLGLVPLMAARTHRLVFSGFISSIFLKRAVRCWCRIVGGWLQLDSYLLPSEKDKNNVDQRENQRQRARQRLMRGDQNEQLGLLEVLEAIEDDTTDDEPADENENDHVENDTNNAQNNDKEACENFSQVADSSKAGESSSAAPFDTDIKNNAAHAEPQQNIPNNVMLDEGMQQQNEQGEHRQARQRVQEQREQRNLGAQHHALLHFRDTALTVEYVRPNLFPLRIVLLLICFAITAILLALSAFLIPVTIGRTLFKKFAITSQSSQIHDLYSIATGVYICWILTRLISMTKEWLHKGWSYMKKVFSTAVWLGFRVIAAAVPLLVVIPFMLGFYFQMLVISPLRVAIFQSPLFFPWKEWAMGVVHFKIICASVLMGPDWWLKTAFEQIYADGIWNFQLKDLYINMVIPIGNALSFLIAFPYVASKFIMLFVEADRENQVIIIRYSYPFFLGSICIVALLIWQWKKLKMLAQKIRNDKYLIGTQLVNFYRDNTAIKATNLQTPNIIDETKKDEIINRI